MARLYVDVVKAFDSIVASIRCCAGGRPLAVDVSQVGPQDSHDIMVPMLLRELRAVAVRRGLSGVWEGGRGRRTRDAGCVWRTLAQGAKEGREQEGTLKQTRPQEEPKRERPWQGRPALQS